MWTCKKKGSTEHSGMYVNNVQHQLETPLIQQNTVNMPLATSTKLIIFSALQVLVGLLFWLLALRNVIVNKWGFDSGLVIFPLPIIAGLLGFYIVFKSKRRDVTRPEASAVDAEDPPSALVTVIHNPHRQIKHQI